jgi:8-oxo-dGTP diphosphatase
MKVAVDIVIFTIQEDALKVLLVKRRIPPFKDRLAIPGGFVLPDEDLDDAALRELRRNRRDGCVPRAALLLRGPEA